MLRDHCFKAVLAYLVIPFQFFVNMAPTFVLGFFRLNFSGSRNIPKSLPNWDVHPPGVNTKFRSVFAFLTICITTWNTALKAFHTKSGDHCNGPVFAWPHHVVEALLSGCLCWWTVCKVLESASNDSLNANGANNCTGTQSLPFHRESSKLSTIHCCSAWKRLGWIVVDMTVLYYCRDQGEDWHVGPAGNYRQTAVRYEPDRCISLQREGKGRNLLLY